MKKKERIQMKTLEGRDSVLYRTLQKHNEAISEHSLMVINYHPTDLNLQSYEKTKDEFITSETTHTQTHIPKPLSQTH